jgi:hypothetical protein
VSTFPIGLCVMLEPVQCVFFCRHSCKDSGLSVLPNFSGLSSVLIFWFFVLVGYWQNVYWDRGGTIAPNKPDVLLLR